MSSQPVKSVILKSKDKYIMTKKVRNEFWKIPLKKHFSNQKVTEMSYKIQKMPDILGKEFRDDNIDGFDAVSFIEEFQRVLTDRNTIIRTYEKENPITKEIETINVYKKYLGDTKYKLKTGEAYGVTTGKKNKLSVIDLDTQTWTKENKFLKYCCEKLEIEQKENIQETVIEIVKKINTYTVQTPKGGFHLYFHNEYADNISNSQNEEENVDIRGKNGYIVGALSTFIKPDGKTVQYKPFLDVPLKNICDKKPMDFLELFDTIKSWDKKYNNKKNIDKSKKIKKYKDRPIELQLYDYTFTDKQLDRIEKLIPDKFFIDAFEWKKLTMFYAKINRKDRWDKISYEKRFISGKNQYNKYENEQHFNSALKDMNNYTMVEYILKSCGLLKELPYYKHKKIPENVIQPIETFEKKRVSDYFYESTIKGIYEEQINDLEGQNLVIKSGTATGKSYFFKHYHSVKLNKETPIMSIVSRVSLAEEHLRTFEEYNNEIYNYSQELEEDDMVIGNKTIGDIKFDRFRDYNIYNKCNIVQHHGDNLIVQVDSLLRLEQWYNEDFGDYCIFIDEFNSVFEYIMSSDTLKNKRRKVFKLFSRIIKNAKQVIMCDADISDTALMYLNIKYWEKCGINLTEEEKDTYNLICPNIDFKFIENTHKHYKNTESEELFNYELLVEQMSKLDKFMVCCDSATESLKLRIKLVEKGLKEDDICVICSKTNVEDKDLDLYDKVIFSPSIVYGLDSQMKREVFCIMTEKTITSKGMLQQVARCRNIKKLWYYFPNKKEELDKGFIFNNQSEVVNRVIALDNYSTNRFKEIIKEVVSDETMSLEEIYNEYDILSNNNGICNSFFMRLINRIIYFEDCDSSNKFLHFKLGIRKLGYNDKELIKDLTKRNKQEQNALKGAVKEAIKEMFIDNMNTDSVIQLNKILKLQTEEQKIYYSDMFCETGAFDKHISFCNLFLEKTKKIDKKLGQGFELDFGSHLCKTSLNKVNFLQKLFKTMEVVDFDLYGKKELSESDATKYYAEYNLIWKNRKNVKKNPFLDKYELAKFLKDAIKDLVGFSPYTSESIKTYVEDENGKSKRVTRTAYSLNTESEEYQYHQSLRKFRVKPKKEEYDECLLD
jgi:hypothetical protein